jgi:hypothetical protein
MASGTLSGSITGTVSCPAVYGSIQSQRCCCWEISGDYLLNSDTGQVWLINKEKLELLPLTKHLMPIDNAVSAVKLEALKYVVLETKDLELAKMPVSIRKPISGHIDTLIKVLDQEIGNKKKAIKIP